MFQISMDWSSVNWKFFEEIVKDRKENGLHQLINIGSCGLRTVSYMEHSSQENQLHYQ